MSIITNGESLSSGKEELVSNNHFHSDSNNSLSSITTLSNGSTTQLPRPIIKKKRNPPGNPDPSAEVIALSPNTLVAKNRFVCEICSKGFQRDQNLQLHRRGHNLPWKLRQRSANEVVRKRVYVCPEASCVHHNASRALGDLTGIKKHFSRKHGLKKWKCDRCSKNYAVHSDFKAHSKTCGTRQYNCECGTIFSRRDSFITHRAFCDALAEENSKTTILSVERQVQQSPELISNNNNTIPTNDKNIIDHDQTSRDPIMFTNSATCPYMSATALLQKAAQMGSTFGRGSIMAPPSQFFNNNNNNNNMGFFGGLIFGHCHQNLGGKNEVVLHGEKSDVMMTTVDFLGIDERSQNSKHEVNNNNGNGDNNHDGLDDHDQVDLMFDGDDDESGNVNGLSQYEQQAELFGKQSWEV